MKINFKEKIIIVVIFQLIVIFSLIFINSLAISSGKEVLIEIESLSKQSRFGQEYLDIEYTISNIEREDKDEFEKDDVVYVVLESNSQNNLHVFKSIQKDKPSEGTFIRGKVSYKKYCSGFNYKYNCSINIVYGIESFFMPNVNLYDLNGDGYAKILIDKDGGSTLKEVYINNKKL